MMRRQMMPQQLRCCSRPRQVKVQVQVQVQVQQVHPALREWDSDWDRRACWDQS
jgi:hypothetical protein